MISSPATLTDLAVGFGKIGRSNLMSIPRQVQAPSKRAYTAQQFPVRNIRQGPVTALNTESPEWLTLGLE